MQGTHIGIGRNHNMKPKKSLRWGRTALSCQKGILCVFEGDQSCGVSRNRLFIPGVSVRYRMGWGGREASKACRAMECVSVCGFPLIFWLFP